MELAAQRGVPALAVTDHDTLAGLPGAMRRGRELGLEVVPGIELSVHDGDREVHLLGYFVSRPEPLQALLEEIVRRRETRAQRILELLAALGCPLEYEDVWRRSHGVLGRPHVAEALVEHGFVTSFNEAFERFLAAGRPAFVPKETPSLAQGAEFLRRSGAVPVMAHPGASDCDAVLPRLRREGVVGLEVWHPQHSEADVRRYLRIATRHGLQPTGGSDFHREAPGVLLPGDLPVPASVLEALRLLAV